jgi:hypothetical protein
MKEGRLMMTANNEEHKHSHRCQLQTCLLSEKPPIADGRQADVVGAAPALTK